MLAVKCCVSMEANAPSMILPYYTNFVLEESVAPPEVDLLSPVPVSSVTLCTNIVAAVGVPTAIQGHLCVCCLHY
jgi:hypothetical protein